MLLHDYFLAFAGSLTNQSTLFAWRLLAEYYGTLRDLICPGAGMDNGTPVFLNTERPYLPGGYKNLWSFYGCTLFL